MFWLILYCDMRKLIGTDRTFIYQIVNTRLLLSYTLIRHQQAKDHLILITTSIKPTICHSTGYYRTNKRANNCPIVINAVLPWLHNGIFPEGWFYSVINNNRTLPLTGKQSAVWQSESTVTTVSARIMKLPKIFLSILLLPSRIQDFVFNLFFQ
jgi:hypothetical protein